MKGYEFGPYKRKGKVSERGGKGTDEKCILPLSVEDPLHPLGSINCRLDDIPEFCAERAWLELTIQGGLVQTGFTFKGLRCFHSIELNNMRY